MERPKLAGIQGSDGVRHAGRLADPVGVDCSDSEVVGVSFEEPGHGVFTDLNGVIIALAPVVSSNLTSTKGGFRQEQMTREPESASESHRQHSDV